MRKRYLVPLAGIVFVLCICAAIATSQEKSKSGMKPKAAAAHKPVNINVTTGAANPRHLRANVGDSVDFTVSKDCTVTFTNPAIFGTASAPFTQGKPNPLIVKAEGKTEYCVVGAPCPPADKGAKAGGSGPNDITVP